MVILQFLTIMLLFLFMTNGYSILKSKMDFNMTTSIKENMNNKDMSGVYGLDLEFLETENWGNIFFYDIYIYNNSDQAYRDWKIKIIDTGYINLLSWSNGIRLEDGWEIDYSSWNGVIESGGTVTISISFEVIDNLNDSMSIKEYAEYFMKNFVIVTNCEKSVLGKDEKLITNGKASLVLKNGEEEIKTYTIEKDSTYISDNPNQRLYILNINNNSNNKYLKIRSNIYFGDENDLVYVSPNEMSYKSGNNITLDVPDWIEIPANSSASIYISIITENEDYIPDVVIAALVE